MVLICNELSYHPVAASDNEAELRFTQLLDSFKVAKKTFGFETIRFHSNFAQRQKKVFMNGFQQYRILT